MKILKQLLIIFLLCLCGQLISGILPVIIPGNVISMLLLLLLLSLKIIKTESIKETTEFLLANLAFFFVPLTVGIFDTFDTLKGSIAAILIICSVTTFLTFAVTVYTVIFIIKIMDKKKEAANE